MEMDTMTVVTVDDLRRLECAPIRGHHRATRDIKKTPDAVDVRDQDPRPKTAQGTNVSQLQL
jgi:hypothetical protein